MLFSFLTFSIAIVFDFIINKSVQYSTVQVVLRKQCYIENSQYAAQYAIPKYPCPGFLVFNKNDLP